MLAHNACAILSIAGRTDIPVYLGAEKPLLRPYQGQSGILVHGENGFGGISPPLKKLSVDLQDDLDTPGAISIKPIRKDKVAAQFMAGHRVNCAF